MSFNNAMLIYTWRNSVLKFNPFAMASQMKLIVADFFVVYRAHMHGGQKVNRVLNQ